MTLVLTDLCLKTIVEHFPRYNLAFNTTKDNDMMRRFEFLQRKYSFELLTRLSVTEDSFEEYVDLLINKHLKVLDTTWLRNCTWEKVTSKIAEIGSNVEKISFHSLAWEEVLSWQDLISDFPNLKCFVFKKFCTNLYLKHIATFCPNIEEINLDGCFRITSHGVNYLYNQENGESYCTKLKKLYIDNTNICVEDVICLLNNLPSLEIIDSCYLPTALYLLHKKDFRSLDKVTPYNIAELHMSDVSSPKLKIIRKICLSVCPHLRSLTWHLLKKDELSLFSNLSELEHLNIVNCSESKINIDDLLNSKGSKLISLKIKSFTVSLFALAESCPLLEELKLERVSFIFDKDFVSALENFNASEDNRARSLKSIEFIKCDISSYEIKNFILKCCERYPIEKVSFFQSLCVEKEFIKDLLLHYHTLSYLNIEECFTNESEEELLEFAKLLPNKPKIDVGTKDYGPLTYRDIYMAPLHIERGMMMRMAADNYGYGTPPKKMRTYLDKKKKGKNILEKKIP